MRVVIPLIFFALAIWFLLGAGAAKPPVPDAVAVDPAELSTEPERDLMNDPPTSFIGGYDQRCEACHMLFESKPLASRTLLQHEDILLDHGLNDRCYNCHALANRNKLELHDGTLIEYARVPDLCAKCHGPTFRDWERGTHGKTLGSWDATSDHYLRLKCTECHDPHAPAFAPLEPLPGPNTLRMGERLPHVAGGRRRNPLQIWSGADAEHAEEHAEDHGGDE